MIEQTDAYFLKDLIENGWKAEGLKNKVEVVATPPNEIMEKLVKAVDKRREEILRSDILSDCSTNIKEIRAYSEDGVWFVESGSDSDVFYKNITIEDMIKEFCREKE